MDFSAEFAFAVGKLGLKPDEFWLLTPAEFFIMFDGWQENQKEKFSELISLAWYTAAFSRQEKLPPLKGLLQQLENTQQHQKQTDEEMLAMVKVLNAAFGGEVVET